MIAGKPLPNVERQPWDEMGEHVELFYNYPDMAERYYHVAVNPNGIVIPVIQSGTTRDDKFRTQAKIATKVLSDRWVLEMAIPAREIGMKCFDGATWKLNVGRSRYNKTLEHPEPSSCCNGAYHGAANFVNIKFVPERGKGLYQNSPVSSWSNAGFESTVPNAKVSKYYQWKDFTFLDGAAAAVPRNWYGRNLRGEYLEEGGNHFVRLMPGKDSFISQYYVSDAPGKVRISFRIRGSGKVALWTALYTDNDARKKGYRLQPKSERHEVFAASSEWKTFSVVREKNGLPTERLAVRFTPQKDSMIDLDDVFVSPME
jgi:hypothetical protein